MPLRRFKSNACRTVAWATAVVFAFAPLQAQAAMSAGAEQHHVNCTGHDGDHDSDHGQAAGAAVAHDHADHSNLPSNDGGHNKSASHAGSCCGSFCHSAVQAAPVVILEPPAARQTKGLELAESASGIEPLGLLRPPKT